MGDINTASFTDGFAQLNQLASVGVGIREVEKAGRETHGTLFDGFTDHPCGFLQASPL
jgi:hypothetical protein